MPGLNRKDGWQRYMEWRQFYLLVDRLRDASKRAEEAKDGSKQREEEAKR